jgi:hypothetical protein
VVDSVDERVDALRQSERYPYSPRTAAMKCNDRFKLQSKNLFGRNRNAHVALLVRLNRLCTKYTESSTGFKTENGTSHWVSRDPRKATMVQGTTNLFFSKFFPRSAWRGS